VYFAGVVTCIEALVSVGLTVTLTLKVERFCLYRNFFIDFRGRILNKYEKL
jgi:hypothetical protein